MAATFKGIKRHSPMNVYVSEFFDRRRLTEMGFSASLTNRPAREVEILLECHAKLQQLEAERRKRQADKDRRRSK
jgi:hypothetical protein